MSRSGFPVIHASPQPDRLLEPSAEAARGPHTVNATLPSYLLEV